MIATKRRLSLRDGVLILLSAFVLMMALSPIKSPRQTVEVHGPGAAAQTFSLAIDDPTLVTIRRQLSDTGGPRPNGELGLARWRGEVARYYAESSDDQPSAVDRWARLRDESDLDVARIEQTITKINQLAGPPPIILGAVIKGGYRSDSIIKAALISLIVVLMMAVWTRWQPVWVWPADPVGPAIAKNPANAETSPTDPINAIALRIPANWLRIHQPLGVIVRRIVYTGMVVAALMIQTFRW